MEKLLGNFLLICWSYTTHTAHQPHNPWPSILKSHPRTSPYDLFVSQVGNGAVYEDYFLPNIRKIQSLSYYFNLLAAFCYSNKALRLNFLKGRKTQCFPSIGGVPRNLCSCKIPQKPLCFTGTLTGYE